MQRNWDTIREILIATEALRPNQNLTLTDFSNDRAHEVSYHVEMLTNAGLLDATVSKTLSKAPSEFFVRNMTWSGHEFLDAIREKTIWEKTKSTINEKGGSMTFNIIQSVAVAIAKQTIGL